MSVLEGRTAIVTGGAQGIGYGAAVGLANECAHVIVADVDLDAAERAVERIRDSGGSAHVVQADVADSAACTALVKDALTTTGRLDVLFHAAAVQFQDTLAEDTTDEFWRRFIATNLDSTFYLCRAAVPAMRDTGGGSITLMASGRVYMGAAGSTAYAASKGGVASFTRSLAWEVGPDDINVNCLVPGFTDTDGSRRFQREVLGRDPEDVVAEFAAQDPMGRISTPADIATMVVYLATTGRWITGQMHSLRMYTR